MDQKKQAEPHPDFLWAWGVLCDAIRPDPLPTDAAQPEPEPVPATAPAEPTSNDGAYEDV